MRSILVVALTTLSVSGCASYQTVLKNKKGETITCEASGKSGIITGYYLKEGFDSCVNSARKAGFN